MALLEYFRSFPVHMDYKGQEKAESLARIIITTLGVIGFIWGYVTQYFSYTVYILGVGFALTLVIALPPWPIYRRHPLNWQKNSSQPNTPQKDAKSKKKK